MKTDGLKLGGWEGEEITISAQSLSRHLLLIGKAGSGKSVLMRYMSNQNVARGDCMVFIDPQGLSALNVVSDCPEERKKDLVFFNPGAGACKYFLDLLSFRNVDERNLFIDSFVGIVKHVIYRTNPDSFTKDNEIELRMAILLAIDAGIQSFSEVLTILSDAKFANKYIQKTSDPKVREYWDKRISSNPQNESHFVTKLKYIFSTNAMKDAMDRTKMTIDFSAVLSENKVFVADLAKGRIGEENAEFLGMLLLAKLHEAGLRQYGIPQDKRNQCYVYIDEAYNFASANTTFSGMLSESRPMKLSFILSIQTFSQLSVESRTILLGNVSNLAILSISSFDVEFLSPGVPQDILKQPFPEFSGVLKSYNEKGEAKFEKFSVPGE